MLCWNEYGQLMKCKSFTQTRQPRHHRLQVSLKTTARKSTNETLQSVRKYRSNHMIRLAHDTTVVRFISDNDESEYRVEILQLVEWCRENALSLNVEKTKEGFLISGQTAPTPLHINGSAVESVCECTCQMTSQQHLTPPLPKKPSYAFTQK